MARINDPLMESRQPGMIEAVQTTLRAVAEYFSVRFELAGYESKAVFGKVVKAAIGVAVALLSLMAGLLYLSLSLIYVLAVKAQWGWGYAFLVSGIVLLIVMVVGLLIARGAVKGSWFPTTVSELKKDTQWLKQKTPTNV
jgi:uncharacterized membrane protein YqjE